MDPRSLTLNLLLALFFRPILSATPSPSPSPFLPDSSPPAPDSFPWPPAPDSPPPPPPTFSPSPPPPTTPPPPPTPPPATPPPPPTPSPATSPPFRAPLLTPPNRMGPDRSGFRPPPPCNTSPTHHGSSSSSPSGHRDCHQPRRSVNRESPTRPGLNFGEKLGLFFIGVVVALQVVFGSFLVYIRRS